MNLMKKRMKEPTVWSVVIIMNLMKKQMKAPTVWSVVI